MNKYIKAQWYVFFIPALLSLVSAGLLLWGKKYDYSNLVGMINLIVGFWLLVLSEALRRPKETKEIIKKDRKAFNELNRVAEASKI